MIMAPDESESLYVGVADLAAAAGNRTIATLGLGSCVALVLHDRDAAVGGIAHVLLPGPEYATDRSNAAKFPVTAIEALLKQMYVLGARKPRARLIGGASMFGRLLETGGVNMGERNVKAARAALESFNIPIDGEDVGGDYGRSVFLRVADGRLKVRSLRGGDTEL